MSTLEEQIKKSQIILKMSVDELIHFTNAEKNSCVSIKSKNRYLFKNKNYEKIINTKKITIIHQKQEEEVLLSNKPMSFRELVEVKDQKNMRKVIITTLYPLQIESETPNGVLRICYPENKQWFLYLDKILHLPVAEINQYLNQKKYEFSVNKIIYSFSRRELMCLIELLKGKQAGEIAEELKLKQVTVEFYIKNLKNKCGVSQKSELVRFFINNHILQQIVI